MENGIQIASETAQVNSVASMRTLLIVVLLIQLACGASGTNDKVQRAPLEKSNAVFETPKEYSKRFISTDPKTGKPVYHDQNPRVVPVNKKAGKYEIRWIGYDGKEKVIEYQRADALDVVVAGSVRIEQNGEYLCDYQVQSLPSSSTYLHVFVVQNFSSEVTPSRIGDNYVGHMLREIPQFSTGNWLAFFCF